MAQWFKDPTAAAQFAAETQVWSLAQCNGLKYLVLLQLWHKLQLGDPWPGNFHITWVQPPPPQKKRVLKEIFFKYAFVAYLNMPLRKFNIWKLNGFMLSDTEDILYHCIIISYMYFYLNWLFGKVNLLFSIKSLLSSLDLSFFITKKEYYKLFIFLYFSSLKIYRVL